VRQQLIGLIQKFQMTRCGCGIASARWPVDVGMVDEPFRALMESKEE
jgi:hypothetical protein